MIAIVTDSSVYMTRNEAKSLGVWLVPLTYTVNGHIYNETFIGENGDFQRLVFRSNVACQTAHANIAAFMSTFSELVNSGFEVLCITISSRLSGTYSSASIAAREVSSDKITVVDSQSTAGGMYMLVEKARAMALAGASVEEIADELQDLRSKITIAFSVDDMTPLRNSGRLGIVRQSVGTVLNLKPMLKCVDGAVISDGMARGRYNQISRMAGQIPEDANKVFVHYVKDSDTVSALYNEVRRRFPAIEVKKRQLGPVLAIHLGQSTVGVVWS
jgi:DegV family protein with EDD domain